jgi:hypothetical protein
MMVLSRSKKAAVRFGAWVSTVHEDKGSHSA